MAKKNTAAPTESTEAGVRILRSQQELEACESMKEIIATFIALGGTVPASGRIGSNMATAKSRVRNLMLSAQDNDAHTGVPKDANPQVRTNSEIEQKCADRGIEAVPQTVDDGQQTTGTIKFPQGSMAAQLQEQADQAGPAPQPKPAPAPKPQGTRGKRAANREAMYGFQCTFAGTTRLQEQSKRNNMYQYVKAAPNRARTLEELNTHFDCDTRGEMAKLVRFNHLRQLTKEEYEALPAEVPLPPESAKDSSANDEQQKARA